MRRSHKNPSAALPLCGPKHYSCVTISPAKVVQRCAGAGIWGILVRFNDLMQTVLAAEGRSGLGAVTLWRQCVDLLAQNRSEEHTSELQSLMRISYAVFCLKKKNKMTTTTQI